MVLKRVYNSSGQALSTYYVYDEQNHLSFVLPPGTDPDNGNITDIKLNNFCYQYCYDTRNRLIEQFIPGKGWNYTVYTPTDLVVLTGYSGEVDQ